MTAALCIVGGVGVQGAVGGAVVDELHVVHHGGEGAGCPPRQPGEAVGELLAVQAAQLLLGGAVAELMRDRAGLRNT